MIASILAQYKEESRFKDRITDGVGELAIGKGYMATYPNYKHVILQN